jgi:tetratricopeptide (TPR) repeat protein
MPILYFSLNDPGSITVIQNIMQECRQSLEAKCLGPEDPEGFSRQTLVENLSLCDALIIVISRTGSPAEITALPVDDFKLDKRLRFEIVSAMNMDLMIVPLLLDGAVLPKRRNLQGALKHLCDCKSYTLRSAFLQEDLEEALDDIEEELNFKKEVEEKMSLSVEESFQRLAGYDAKPGKPSSLESFCALDLRRLVESETIFLKKARGIGDKQAEKNALSALGMAYTRLGQTKKAIDFFLQELDIAKESGDSKEQCSLLANLGDAYAIFGKLDQARKHFEKQKALATAKGHSAFIGSSYNGLGFVYVKQNNIEKAIDCYLKALASYRQQKDHDKELELLVGIGLNYQKLGQYEPATAFFVQALATAKYVENRKEEAHILIDLAETYHQLGDTEHLKPILKQAEEILDIYNAAWTPSLKNRLNILKGS